MRVEEVLKRQARNGDLVGISLPISGGIVVPVGIALHTAALPAIVRQRVVPSATVR